MKQDLKYFNDICVYYSQVSKFLKLLKNDSVINIRVFEFQSFHEIKSSC